MSIDSDEIEWLQCGYVGVDDNLKGFAIGRFAEWTQPYDNSTIWSISYLPKI